LKAGEVDHERLLLPIDQISPSPDNALLYRPSTPNDPDTIKLAESIRANGVKEPLVVSGDFFIMSGHRRYYAGRIVGLTKLPCRFEHDTRRDKMSSDEWLAVLKEYNVQRVKTRDEVLREAVVSVNPEDAHRALTAHRRGKGKIKIEAITPDEYRRRKAISPAKQEFLDAIQRVIEELREFWPLSLRQIHYNLLNDPPLKHSGKPRSRYRGDHASSKSLTELVTRARVEGLIDQEVIDDPTRPVTVWDVERNLAGYYAAQMEDLLNGYWRDLMQSQPNHVEIVLEKNTLQNILRPVAMNFCIPFTSGRGMTSTRPVYNIAKRYRQSGKQGLAIIAVGDLDPDGDAIVQSLDTRLRYEYKVPKLSVVKAALTMDQVRELGLPKSFETAHDKKSSHKARYLERYGEDGFIWELEALPPMTLQRLVTQAIDLVIDRKAFNHEVTEEKKDAAHNAAVREIVLRTLREEIAS